MSQAVFYQLKKNIFCLVAFWAAFFTVLPSPRAQAEEINILFTGSTHAMLYQCNCPRYKDGGVARRATLIKQIRAARPNPLLLDAGSFFAGGLLDEHTQSVQLDMQRTAVNLQAMEIMKYDAAAVAEDELNFGKGFLEENIARHNIPFVSCNIKMDKVKPYVIKEIAGSKVGITAVTSLAAMQKTGEVKFIEPRTALRQAVEELRKQGAKIIILLSSLEENESILLSNNIPGIDVVVIARGEQKEPVNKIDSTIFVRSHWQGRSLGRLTLILKEGKIADYKAEAIRLSDQVADDREIQAILPRCFTDNECNNRQGMVGKCQDPGTPKSSCVFTEALKIPLLVVLPKDCLACNPKFILNLLKKTFPGITASYLYYPSPRADKFIRDFSITGLPAYIFGKEIEKDKRFDSLKKSLVVKGSYYMLKPEASGINYFLGRERIKGKLDLFISLYDNGTGDLLDNIKEYKPQIHFLAVEKKEGGLEASKGNQEVEEYLRSACVERYYPQRFWGYITCRAKHNDSSWWEDCLEGEDSARIKACAKSAEGEGLLKENIRLNAELEVMFGPTYLIQNQEVFSSRGVPSKEELKKILKR